MAAIVAGEVGPYFTGIIYCSLLSACLAIGDLRRAGEWSDAAADWCATIPPDSPFPGDVPGEPGRGRAPARRVARGRGGGRARLRRAADVVEPGLAAAAFLQLGRDPAAQGRPGRRRGRVPQAHELGEDPQPGLALLRLAQGKRRRRPRRDRRGARRGRSRPPAPGAAARGERRDRARRRGDRRRAGVRGGARPDRRGDAARRRSPRRRRRRPGRSRSRRATSTGPWRASGRPCAGWQDLRLPYEAVARPGRGSRARSARPGTRTVRRSSSAPRSRASSGWARSATPATVAALLGDADALPGGLTAREAEVLRLLASGKTNRTSRWSS